MHIKKNDTVKIVIGSDAGKTGKVVRAFPKLGKILVEGINMHKKHMKSRQEGKKGQTIDKAFPISVSNVKLAEKRASK
jgi:large subunit ribosomal protein L24